ncbi:MAG: coenzyme F430 synthase [Methanococci archaeon]|nr:coenzyme F430 synthase [Methanococci archaeon]
MLIVDINHGGLILAEEYLKLGYDVEIFDIYKKLKKSSEALAKYKKLKETYGNKIEVVNTPNFDKYDEIIAPIHCPIDCDFLPFNDAVSFLIEKKYGKLYKKIINITGVKGKTTTTSLIDHILKDQYNIFIHNSNSGSISPPTVLDVLNKLNNISHIDDYDYFIFETSLGLVKCKFGAITNILENYKIAGGRRSALIAKFGSLKNADYCFVNKIDVEKYHLTNLNFKKDISILDIEKSEIIQKYPLKFKYNGINFEFNEKVFGNHFVENAIFSFEICKFLVDVDHILDRLKSFNLKNRMEIKKIEDKVVVKNVNPGLDIKAIKYAIKDFLEVFNGDIYIGGDFGIVCEEINVKKLADVLKQFNCKYYFVGDIGKELRKYIDGEIVDEIKEEKFDKNVLLILRKKLL